MKNIAFGPNGFARGLLSRQGSRASSGRVLAAFFTILAPLLLISACAGFESAQYRPPDAVSQDRFRKVDPGADPIEVYEERNYWESLNE